jgi:hypothetical protein
MDDHHFSYITKLERKTPHMTWFLRTSSGTGQDRFINLIQVSLT